MTDAEKIIELQNKLQNQAVTIADQMVEISRLKGQSGEPSSISKAASYLYANGTGILATIGSALAVLTLVLHMLAPSVPPDQQEKVKTAEVMLQKLTKMNDEVTRNLANGFTDASKTKAASKDEDPIGSPDVRVKPGGKAK
jgi:hypothetical protein